VRKTQYILALLLLLFVSARSSAAESAPRRRVALSPLVWDKGDYVGSSLSKAAVETLAAAFGEQGNWEVVILEASVPGDRLTATARNGSYDYIIFGRISFSRGYQLQLSLYDFGERTIIANRSTAVQKSVEIFGMCDLMALSLVSDMTGSEGQEERIEYASLFGGGKGTPADPFRIRTADHLINVDQAPFAAFRLENDIDLTGIPWVPLSPLLGQFDGNGKTLMGLSMSGDPYRSSGLFSGLLPGGSIFNLTLDEVHLVASDSAGALAGYNHGEIRDVLVMGKVAGEYSTGGIVGYNEGVVERCRFQGEILGNLHSVGGIVGRNIGEITLCRFDGAVKNVGKRSRPKEDYAAGSLDGTYFDAGGVAGWNRGSILRCRASGSVKSVQHPAGGIVGQNNGTISECLFSGSVTAGPFDAGGISGYTALGGTIRNCLVMNAVIVSGDGAGGLCGGTDTGRIENSCTVGVRINAPRGDRFSPRRGNAVISRNREYRILSDLSGGKAEPVNGWDFQTVWILTPDGPDLRDLP
jgi:hypothetical protein